MRRFSLLALAALWGFAPGAYAEEGPAPTPSPDRVDHAKPTDYLAMGPKIGVGPRSLGIVRQLRGKETDRRRLLGLILRWTDRNLRLDPDMAKRWRGVDQIVKDGSRGGPADRAMVIGTFARAAGIPTTWVKTLSLDCIKAAKTGRTPVPDNAGHVFLEVFLGGAWRLLDPETARLYESYDPRVRRLPGDQLAFDKGGDPYALVLSNRFELWRKQVDGFVSSVVLKVNPWANSTDLLARWRVSIAGKGGAAMYARATCQALGFTVDRSFTVGHDEALAAVRGNTLIVVCKDGVPVLPRRYWKAWLPAGHEQILSGANRPKTGWVAHRLSDGTRVILVTAEKYGPVELAVCEALEQ